MNWLFAGKVVMSSSCAMGIPSHRAFSLVEITMALGIATFAILAIAGLLVVGLNQSRDAAQDTNVRSITKTLTTALRASDDVTTVGPTMYFDSDANQVTQPGEAFYECTISLVPTPSGSVFDDIDSSHLSCVQMEIQWPYGAPQPNKVVRHTSIAHP